MMHVFGNDNYDSMLNDGLIIKLRGRSHVCATDGKHRHIENHIQKTFFFFPCSAIRMNVMIQNYGQKLQFSFISGTFAQFLFGMRLIIQYGSSSY